MKNLAGDLKSMGLKEGSANIVLNACNSGKECAPGQFKSFGDELATQMKTTVKAPDGFSRVGYSTNSKSVNLLTRDTADLRDQSDTNRWNTYDGECP
jgi:hypothetical protein